MQKSLQQPRLFFLSYIHKCDKIVTLKLENISFFCKNLDIKLKVVKLQEFFFPYNFNFLS